MARGRGRRLKGLSHGMNVFRIAIKFNRYDFARNTCCLNDLKVLTKSKNPPGTHFRDPLSANFTVKTIMESLLLLPKTLSESRV
jgi:hypothetical protein